jgi:hypothetical protein
VKILAFPDLIPMEIQVIGEGFTLTPWVIPMDLHCEGSGPDWEFEFAWFAHAPIIGNLSPRSRKKFNNVGARLL